MHFPTKTFIQNYTTKIRLTFSSHKIFRNKLKNLTFLMLFQMIIHQFFTQYQNEMNSTKTKQRAVEVKQYQQY